jgi:hypothetical protein
MVSPLFPEAFQRFERDVNIKDLTFNEVIREFSDWQNYRTTGKQEQAIQMMLRMEKRLIRLERILRRNKHYNIYRNASTGRFAKRKS